MQESVTTPDPENGIEPRQQGGSELLAFEDRRSRHAFVRKVMSVVGAQLIVSLLFVLLSTFVDEVKLFILSKQNAFILFICIVICMIITMMTCCCYELFRKFPLNIILLWIFTLAFSYMAGYISAFTYPELVIYALGLTVLICFALITFACQTSCDFTGFGVYLLIGALVLIVAGIVSIFFRSRIFLIIIASFGILLYSMFLIYDIQLMIGGDHQFAFEEDDYVMAALSIYIDIMMIFLKILELLRLLVDDG